jgi:hypothetical protein
MSEFENPEEVPFSPEIEEKQENTFGGLIGAIGGALLGGASIILFSQLGYVSAISGLILAFCTLKGYELLGKKRGATGTILCILLMLLVPYLADRIGWAVEIYKAFEAEGITFKEAFRDVHPTIELNELTGDYIKNLVMVYGFTALGAFGTLRGAFKKK